MNTEQIQRIKDNQKFLLKLLHLHIGNYYPLRRWLGIDYTGKIDEISHLSYGYDTKYFKKGTQWYKKQTRVYQQPDLGYKLNLLLDKMPQLSFSIPALLQPSYSFLWLFLFGLTTTDYQPPIKDATIMSSNPNWNYGTFDFLYEEPALDIHYESGSGALRSLIHWDISDIPDNASFSDATIKVYLYGGDYSGTIYAYRLTRTNWTENGVTWNKYDGTNAWTTAGGDYTTTNGVSVDDAYSDLIFSHCQNLIQDCYNNQSKNVHLIFKTAESKAAGNAYYDRTAETLAPRLTVTYTDFVRGYSALPLCTYLRSADEIDSQSSLSLSTTLEPNRWKKDNTHTQTWVKEQTHDKMYKS